MSEVADSNLQVSHTNSIQNDPHAHDGSPPKQLPSSGISQNPLLNRGIEWLENRDRDVNPCKLCCKVTIAAQVLSVLNLIVLFGAFILVAKKWGTPSRPIDSGQKGLQAGCWYQQLLTPSTIFSITVYVDTLATLTCLATTIAFIATVFSSLIKLELDMKIKILFCNMYMWSHFFYPSWLCHIMYFIDFLNVHDECGKFSTFLNWMLHVFVLAIPILLWNICNGLMGLAFKKDLQRNISSMPQQGELLGAQVPITEAVVSAPELEEATENQS